MPRLLTNYKVIIKLHGCLPTPPCRSWDTNRLTIRHWRHRHLSQCNWSVLVSHATPWASVSGRRRKQLGEDTTAVARAASRFRDKCYKTALCKRSRLIIIFPSTRECYTHADWALRRSSLVHQHCVMLQLCANYQLHATGRRQSTFAATSFWSKILIMIIDCCVCENENNKKIL